MTAWYAPGANTNGRGMPLPAAPVLEALVVTRPAQRPADLDAVTGDAQPTPPSSPGRDEGRNSA